MLVFLEKVRKNLLLQKMVFPHIFFYSYLPTQNLENISPASASDPVIPVILPSAVKASYRSDEINYKGIIPIFSSARIIWLCASLAIDC